MTSTVIVPPSSVTPRSVVPSGIAVVSPSCDSAFVGPASSCSRLARATPRVCGTSRRTAVSAPSRSRNTVTTVRVAGVVSVAVDARGGRWLAVVWVRCGGAACTVAVRVAWSRGEGSLPAQPESAAAAGTRRRKGSARTDRLTSPAGGRFLPSAYAFAMSSMAADSSRSEAVIPPASWVESATSTVP